MTLHSVWSQLDINCPFHVPFVRVFCFGLMLFLLSDRRVATCKPSKPGLTSFSESLAFFFIQFLSFRKMKVQDRQNGPSGLPEKTGWLRACQI